MCAPVVLLALSTAATAGGVFMQSEAKRDAAHLKKKQDRANAMVSNKLAEDALKRGKLKEQRHISQLKSTEETQRASFAKQGISLAEGSPIDVLLNTRDIGNLDAAIIRENAEREAEGFKADETRFLQDAKFAGKTESFARQGGVLQTFGTVLGGASKIAET